MIIKRAADGSAESKTVPQTSSEYKPVSWVSPQGGTAPDGVPYVQLIPRYVDRPGVWVSVDDLSTGKALERLRRHKMYLFGDHLKYAIHEAEKVGSFPPMPLIAQPGWTGHHFTLPSGEVFSPKGCDPAIVLFDPRPKKCCRKGKLKAWKEGVARLAGNQDLLTFALMIAFAGPLLELSRILENFGFELCGKGGVGKTSVEWLVASAIGGAMEGGNNNFWIPANTTVNGLEQLYPDHADLAMIIDEMGDFCNGETEKVRATKTRELIFRLRSGTTKNRFDSRTDEPTRFVYLTSTNVSLGTLLGELDSATSAAAADRLLTIPIAAERKYGIFDSLPNGCATGREAISQMQTLMLDHHGLAMPRFLKRLVRARASGEDALKAHIDAGIRRFRDAVGVDENDGAEARVADVFGLVYVAGVLAVKYGALPKSFDPLKAAITVYRLNRAAAGPVPTNRERLQELVYHPRTLRIGYNDLRSIPDEELKRAPALLRTARSGELELLLTPAQLERRFGNKGAFYRDPEVEQIALKDKDDRKTVKRTVRTEKGQERFHAFQAQQNEEVNSYDNDNDDDGVPDF